MPKYTSNYNLVKPTASELYDIEVQNGNMDKIDAALGKQKITTYTDLTQIGLAVGSETIEGIAASLPNNSAIVCSTGSSNADIYPDGKLGILSVVKMTNSRIESKWVQRSTGATYISNVVDGTWYGWKRICFQYVSLAQLGITSGSETIELIAETLPENSNLIYSVSTTEENIYPTNYGLVEVTKLTTGRVKFDYTATGGVLYVGMYNVGATTPWSGWHRVMSSEDIDSTVNESGTNPVSGAALAKYAVKKSGDTMTGNLRINKTSTSSDSANVTTVLTQTDTGDASEAAVVVGADRAVLEYKRTDSDGAIKGHNWICVYDKYAFSYWSPNVAGNESNHFLATTKAVAEYAQSKAITTTTDPGDGATVEYPDGTVIHVYE